jgi:DNA-binding MarR family transcriptional regulator
MARLGTEIRRRFTQALAQEVLRPAHYAWLMAIHELPRPSQRTLARAVGIDPRNAVLSVDALEAMGLVARMPDPADRRRRSLIITARGSATLKRIRSVATNLESEFLGPLGPIDRRRLHELLLRLMPAATRPAFSAKAWRGN